MSIWLILPTGTLKAPLIAVQIDRLETLWSKHELCDSVTYPPVIMGMSAVIWATMFYMCSMTDRNRRSLIPNPWRIVLPAFVYFVFMAILSVYFACRSHGALNAVCNSLSNAFDRNGLLPSCGALLDQFGGHSTSVLYYSFLTCTYSVLVLWTFLSVFMLLRCLLGTDFQRTGVEIRELSSGLTVSSAPTPEVQHKVVGGK